MVDDNEEEEEEDEEGEEDDSLPDVRHHSRNDVLRVVACPSRHGKVSYKESSVSEDTDIEYMEEAQGGVAGEVGVANRDNTNTIEKILKRGRRPISGMLQVVCLVIL
jgi:hypothetical protein